MINSLARRTLILTLCLIAVACSGGSGGSGDSSADQGTVDRPGSSAPGSGSPTDPTDPNDGDNTDSETYSVTLSWDAPTQREDGSGLQMSEISRYEIYFYREGTAMGEGTVVSVDGNSTSTNIQVNGSGNYVFAMSCTDLEGNDSDFSEPVIVTL